MRYALKMDAPDYFSLQAAQAAIAGRSSLEEAADPELPAHLLARLADAEAHARKQMAALAPQSAKLGPRLSRALSAVERSRRSLDARYDEFLSVVGEVAKLVQPRSACKRGCSHCCHIPVAMLSTEAEIIGRRIRVNPVRPMHRVLPSDRPFGYQHPCPFLENGVCGIYAHRPVSCRLHFNLDRDDLLCRLIPEKSVPVPLADMRALQAAYFFLSDADPASVIGDVRDFFPAGKGRRCQPCCEVKCGIING